METNSRDYTEFNRRWPEAKARIKAAHPEMTDEELDYEIGQEVALLKRLQDKTGKTESEIFDWLHIMG